MLRSILLGALVGASIGAALAISDLQKQDTEILETQIFILKQLKKIKGIQ